MYFFVGKWVPTKEKKHQQDEKILSFFIRVFIEFVAVDESLSSIVRISHLVRELALN